MLSKLRIDPDSYLYTQHYNIPEWLPEHTMLSQMLWRAIFEMCKGESCSIRREALFWIKEGEVDYASKTNFYEPFCFAWTCQQLGLNGKLILSNLGILLAEPPPEASLEEHQAWELLAAPLRDKVVSVCRVRVEGGDIKSAHHRAGKYPRFYNG
jgi:hypothetical protein